MAIDPHQPGAQVREILVGFRVTGRMPIEIALEAGLGWDRRKHLVADDFELPHVAAEHARRLVRMKWETVSLYKVTRYIDMPESFEPMAFELTEAEKNPGLC